MVRGGDLSPDLHAHPRWPAAVRRREAPGALRQPARSRAPALLRRQLRARLQHAALGDEPLCGRDPADRRRAPRPRRPDCEPDPRKDRKSTRLNSSHQIISYAVFCLKKKKKKKQKNKLYKNTDQTTIEIILLLIIVYELIVS